MNKSIQNALKTLQLSWIRDNLDEEIAEAARKQRTHYELIERLLEGELQAHECRAIERRFRYAKLPGRPTLKSYDFHWPASINADQVRHLFSLEFIRDASNVVFIGGVGLGKTHLAAALGTATCQKRMNTLFTPAATMINELVEARQNGGLTKALKKYLRAELLIVDELGYLPVDKLGAELLFQILAGRYEQHSTIITTNRPFKEWNKTFANDNVMTAAVLDRVAHHCQTIIIKGKSYRLKGRIDTD